MGDDPLLDEAAGGDRGPGVDGRLARGHVPAHDDDELAGADGAGQQKVDVGRLEHGVLGDVAEGDARDLEEADGVQGFSHDSISTEPSVLRTVPSMLAWMGAPSWPSAGWATRSPTFTRSPGGPWAPPARPRAA